MSVYSQDNVAFRQYVHNTLNAILHEIGELDGVDEANIKSGVDILGYTGTYTNEAVMPQPLQILQKVKLLM